MNLYHLLLMLVALVTVIQVIILTKLESSNNMDQLKNNNNPRQMHHQNYNNNNNIVVDVLSVASRSRPEYLQTQRDTWGRHALIRNFFQVDESMDDDVDAKTGRACRDLSIDTVVNVSHFCRAKHWGNKWLMQRYMNYYARPVYLKKKTNPTGWLCAQKRFPIGVARTLLGYRPRGEPLPDYLLVVDDDTYYNMDVYYREIVAKQPSSSPFVGAGCRVTNGPNEEKGVVFPFGGFGLTFSKKSLELMLTPLSDKNATTNTQWQNDTYETIQKDQMFETRAFRDGMNLAELMESFAVQAPYQNSHKWSKRWSYCFHGDWILSIFTYLYGLHTEPMLAAVLNSIIHEGERRPVNTNLCRNNRRHCPASDMVCHYQTPEDMRRLTAKAVSNSVAH